MKKINIRFYEGLFSYRPKQAARLQSKLMGGGGFSIKKPLFGAHLTTGIMDDIVNRYWSLNNMTVATLGIWGSSWSNDFEIEDKYNIVIGHGFGAGKAIKMAAKAGHEIDLLVLFDYGKRCQKFIKPDNVKKCLRFNQTGLFSGDKVSDLDSIACVLNEIF